MRDRYQVAPHEHTHTWTEEELQRVSDYLQILTESKPEYQGSYVNGECYEQGDIVMDSGWQMIANKPTCDKPAPSPIGSPTWIYNGTSPEGQLVAKELLVGQRYYYAESGYINGYRVYTVTGNTYRVFTVSDPDGAGNITEVISFVADTTGWREFSINPVIIAAGSTFEVWVGSIEPDPTPTVWTGDWDYDTPNNPAVPPAGVCSHANSALGILRFAKTDDNGGDRAAELLALEYGDVITGPGGIRWTIQDVPSDQGSYVQFSVAPGQQGTPDGVFAFQFETTTSTPITTVIDTDYFLNNPNVDGRYSIDGGAVVVTQDAYGVDINVQLASISDDWDVLSAFDGASSTSQSTYDYVKAGSTLDVGEVYEDIAYLTTTDCPEGVYELKMAVSWIYDRTNDSAYFQWRETNEEGVWSGWNESTAEPVAKTDTNNNFYSYPVVWGGGVKQIQLQMHKESGAGVLDVNFCDVMWDHKK